MIILASGSPRRKKILKEMGISFKVVKPNISEKTKYRKPSKVVMDLAKKKALSVAKKYPNDIVIGADTVVYCMGRIIGKPKSISDAKRILKIQSGKWQTVYTGVSLVFMKKNIVLTGYEKSMCFMRKIDKREINQIASKHLDKAGGWAVQDKGDRLIVKIKGDYSNIVGLPKKLLKKLLRKVLKLCST